MFIRRTRTRTTGDGKAYFSYRLVRSRRDGDKVRQQTLLNRRRLLLICISPSNGGIHLNDLSDFPGPPQSSQVHRRGLQHSQAPFRARILEPCTVRGETHPADGQTRSLNLSTLRGALQNDTRVAEVGLACQFNRLRRVGERCGLDTDQ